MSGSIYKLVSICIAVAMIPGQAFAGGQTQKCKQAGERAQQECKARNAQNGAADQATGAIRGAQGAADPSIQQGSEKDIAQTQEQIARVQDTQRVCEEAKRKCEQECQGAAQTAGQDDNQMMPHNPDGEYRSQVDNEKQNTCVAPLVAANGDSMAALAMLGAALAAAMAAKKASDKKDDKENEENRKPKCEEPGSEKYTHCNDHYAGICLSNMSAPGCDAFANRYCNLSSSNNGTTDIAITPVQNGSDSVIGTFSAGVVGEGLNSDFCSKVIAARACQKDGGEKCDSQVGFGSDPTGTGGTGTNTAVTTTPAVGLQPESFSDSGLDRFSTNASGEAGSSGGGSGGGMGGASTQSVGAIGGGAGVVEGGYGKVGSIDPGGGSGGGGGYSGNNAGSDYSSIEENRNPASIAGKGAVAAAALTTSATDVAKQYGPSVFSISSIAYQNLCSKNKLNCK